MELELVVGMQEISLGISRRLFLVVYTKIGTPHNLIPLQVTLMKYKLLT